jgi:hypothetical protein
MKVRGNEGDMEEGRKIEILENRILMFIVCSEVSLANKAMKWILYPQIFYPPLILSKNTEQTKQT